MALTPTPIRLALLFAFDLLRSSQCDFASYENRDRWGEVSSFVAANHGNLSVLIHPHSTEGALADHTQHAFWAGEPLPLRIK